MSGFADTTSVPVAKTRAEIEATVQKYGAVAFSSGYDEDRAWIGFRCADRVVRFVIVLPNPRDRSFTHDRNNYRRKEAIAVAAYDQSVRTIWRRLLLCIRAKLESVASGIEAFETAFAAHIVLPSGQTVGEWMGPQIAAAYATGEMPNALMLPPSEKPPPRILPHPVLETGTNP